MSTWPAPSVLDPRTQAFPVLTSAQISRLRPGSKLRKVEPGEILFLQRLKPRHDVSGGGPGRGQRRREYKGGSETGV